MSAHDDGLGVAAFWPSAPVLRRDAERLARLRVVDPDAAPLDDALVVARRAVEAMREHEDERLDDDPVGLGLARLSHGARTTARLAALARRGDTVACDSCGGFFVERRGVLSTACPSCRTFGGLR